MKRSLALVAVGLALAEVVHAQDAVSPTDPSPVADTAALVARVAELEAQLDTCRQTSAAAAPATNLPQPSPAYVPAPRYGGGFRTTPEPKLTCDDYSASYFERYPTMARVCGRNATESVTQQDENPSLPLAEIASSTVVPRVVSATLAP